MRHIFRQSYVHSGVFNRTILVYTNGFKAKGTFLFLLVDCLGGFDCSFYPILIPQRFTQGKERTGPDC